MTQLTVRGVDSTLHEKLRAAAASKGVSINHLVLEILRQASGLVIQSGKRPEYHDLDYLAGTWDAAQAEEFSRLTGEQRTIEADLWR